MLINLRVTISIHVALDIRIVQNVSGFYVEIIFSKYSQMSRRGGRSGGRMSGGVPRVSSTRKPSIPQPPPARGKSSVSSRPVPKVQAVERKSKSPPLYDARFDRMY